MALSPVVMIEGALLAHNRRGQQLLLIRRDPARATWMMRIVW